MNNKLTIDNYCGFVGSFSVENQENRLDFTIAKLILDKIKTEKYAENGLKIEIKAKLEEMATDEERIKVFGQARAIVLCEIEKIEDNLFKQYTFYSVEIFLTEL